MPKVQDVRKAMQEQEQEAWAEYLDETQSRSVESGYTEVELWAWSRLQEELRAIKQHRDRLLGAV